MQKTTDNKAATKSSGSARVLTAVIVLPFLIASILVPWLKWLFVALAIAAMALALFEFYVLAKQRGLNPDTGAGYLAATALVVIAHWQLPGWREGRWDCSFIRPESSQGNEKPGRLRGVVGVPPLGGQKAARRSNEGLSASKTG